MGHWDNGIPDIAIDIQHYIEDNISWEAFGTTYTNETGFARMLNLHCGMFSWEAQLEGDIISSGDFFVHANCGSEDNEADAWFEDLSYSLEDRDGDNQEDLISVDYLILSSDCDCEMDLLLILDIFDDSGDMIDTFEQY